MQTAPGYLNDEVPKTQWDYLIRSLVDLPTAARVVLVYDPDGVTKGREVIEAAGWKWGCFPFWHNVMEISLRFRDRGNDERLLVCITPPTGNNEPGNLSYLPQLVESLEGTIDLSLRGIFKNYFPATVIPANSLERYHRLLGSNLPTAMKACREVIESSRGSLLNDGHVEIMALCAGSPSLRVTDLLDVKDAGVPGLMRLFFLNQLAPEAEDLMREWVPGIFADGTAEEVWARTDRLDIARMLYGCAVLRALDQTADAFNLRGLDLQAPESERMLPLLPQAMAALGSSPELAAQIYQFAQQRLSELDQNRLVDYVSDKDLPVHKALTDLPGDLGSLLLRRRLLEALLGDSVPSWVLTCSEHWPPTLASHDRDDLLEMTSILGSIESRLQTSLTTSPTLQDLVTTYVGSGYAALEYDLWRIEWHANQSQDKDVYQAWLKFRPKLRSRIRQRLLQLDQSLADHVREDVQRFNTSEISVPFVMRDLLQKQGRIPPKVPRVWVVIFDGMRWDLWERVVKPAMERHFQLLEQKPYLALIPSTTKVSRTSLVAGQEPGNWTGPTGQYTEAEELLGAALFNLGQEERREQLNYVNRAEDRAAAIWPEIHQDAVKPYNLLIYNISDDLIHHAQGDPWQIGRQVSESLNFIIPNLVMLVEERDVVLISSDHGFIELDPDDGLDVKVPTVVGDQGMEGPQVRDISYRYTVDYEVEGAIKVEFAHNHRLGPFYVASGHQWFNRPNGAYTRYSHGGISLSEMVVPGAVMTLRTAAAASLVWQEKPHTLQLSEGEPGEAELVLACEGNQIIKFNLAAENAWITPNSGEVRPGQSIKVNLAIGADESEGRIRVSGDGTTQGGEKVLLDTVWISLTREARQDIVKIDVGAFELLEGL